MYIRRFEMTKYYRPEIDKCPFCKTSLKYVSTPSQKTIYINEKESQKIASRAYRCPNEACDKNDIIYRSSKYENLTLPKSSYSMEIVMKIGYLRNVENKTRKAIRDSLLTEDIDVPERTVENIFKNYDLYLSSSIQNNLEEACSYLNKKNGGIILSIDGLQPTKGNDVLYVVRDILSNMIITAKLIGNSKTENLVDFLEPVFRISGINILGVISDGQRALRSAIMYLNEKYYEASKEEFTLKEAKKKSKKRFQIQPRKLPEVRSIHTISIMFVSLFAKYM